MCKDGARGPRACARALTARYKVVDMAKLADFAMAYKMPIWALMLAFSSERIFNYLEKAVGSKILAEMVAPYVSELQRKGNGDKCDLVRTHDKSVLLRALGDIAETKALLGPIAAHVAKGIPISYSVVRKATMKVYKKILPKRRVMNNEFLARLAEDLRARLKLLRESYLMEKVFTAAENDVSAESLDLWLDWQRYDRQMDEKMLTEIMSLDPVLYDNTFGDYMGSGDEIDAFLKIIKKHADEVLIEHDFHVRRLAGRYARLRKSRIRGHKHNACSDGLNVIYLKMSEHVSENAPYCAWNVHAREYAKEKNHERYRGFVWLSLAQLKTLAAMQQHARLRDVVGVRVHFPIRTRANLNYSLETRLAGYGARPIKLSRERAQIAAYNHALVFPRDIWDNAAQNGEEIVERAFIVPESKNVLMPLAKAVKSLKLKQLERAYLCRVDLPVKMFRMLGHVLTTRHVEVKPKNPSERVENARKIAEKHADLLRGYVVAWRYASAAEAIRDYSHNGRGQYLAYFPKELISAAEDKNAARRAAKTGMLDAQVRAFLFTARTLGEKTYKVFNKATSHKVNFADFGVRYPRDGERAAIMAAAGKYPEILRELRVDLATSSEFSQDSDGAQLIMALANADICGMAERVRNGVMPRQSTIKKALAAAEKKGLIRKRHHFHAVPIPNWIHERVYTRAVREVLGKEHVYPVRVHGKNWLVIDGELEDNRVAELIALGERKVGGHKYGVPILLSDWNERKVKIKGKNGKTAEKVWAWRKLVAIQDLVWDNARGTWRAIPVVMELVYRDFDGVVVHVERITRNEIMAKFRED